MNFSPRVLFLVHPEADYGEALLLLGLVEHLGVSRVTVYPHKPTYFGAEVHTWARGTTPHLPLYAGHTARHPWFKPLPGAGLSREEVLQGLRDRAYDLAVWGSLRMGIQAAWDYFKSLQLPLPPAIITDHEDHDMVYVTASIDCRSPVYFKRELHKPFQREGVDVLPLPFSCAWGSYFKPTSPGGDRGGAFVSCSLTHEARHRAIALLAREPNVVVGVNTHHGAAFMTALQRASIGVSIRGLGIDTLRHWEIPFFGALLLTDSTIAVPEDFTDGVDCLRYQTPDELPGKIREALADPDRCVEVARKGQERLLAHHVPAVRARYVLEEFHRRA